jgi:hypothetical protein
MTGIEVEMKGARKWDADAWAGRCSGAVGVGVSHLRVDVCQDQGLEPVQCAKSMVQACRKHPRGALKPVCCLLPCMNAAQLLLTNIACVLRLPRMLARS